jgi:hypothetical protein
MKTTLNIDETVVAELKREAARQGRNVRNGRGCVAPAAALATEARVNSPTAKFPQRRRVC